MNFVCLSPHFPPNYRTFWGRLRAMGVNVLGVADEPYDNLHPDLKNDLKEYYRVTWMEDYSSLVQAVGYFVYNYGNIDRLESHNEYWMEKDARLRTDFSIPGLKSADLPRIKQKAEMKKVFQETGIPFASGTLVNTLDEAHTVLEKVGVPAILKPNVGVGAGKTWKINTPADLEKAFTDISEEDYLLEEFIEGKIFTYDGLIDQSGKIVFENSTTYSEGVLDSLLSDNDIFIHTLRTIDADVRKAGGTLLAAYDVRERFYHIEFFRTPQGGLVALEINLRPPGGTLIDMLNYANDIDLFQQYANIVTGAPFDAVYTHPYFVAHVGRKFNKQYHFPHEKIMDMYDGLIVQHGFLPEIFAPVMGNYFYLVRSPDEEEIFNIAKEIRKKAA